MRTIPLDKLPDVNYNDVMDSKCEFRPTRICTYKIRKSGRGATITLPQAWLEDNGLKPTDRLDACIAADGSLLFRPSKRVPA